MTALQETAPDGFDAIRRAIAAGDSSLREPAAPADAPPSICRDKLLTIWRKGRENYPEDPEGNARGIALDQQIYEAIELGADDRACFALLQSVYAHANRRREMKLLPQRSCRTLDNLGDFLQTYQPQDGRDGRATH